MIFLKLGKISLLWVLGKNPIHNIGPSGSVCAIVQKCSLAIEGRATWCLRGEDLCSNDDVIFFAAKKMTSSLLHKSSPRRHHVARPCPYW